MKPEELKARVLTEQDRFFKQRTSRWTRSWASSPTSRRRRRREGDAELEAARYLQRRAQFYLDFVEAENSTGFHAPQEALRILGDSIDYARQGQLVLRDAAFQPNVKIVAIPTAQPGPSQATGTAPPGTARPAPATKPQGTGAKAGDAEAPDHREAARASGTRRRATASPAPPGRAARGPCPPTRRPSLRDTPCTAPSRPTCSARRGRPRARSHGSSCTPR